MAEGIRLVISQDRLRELLHCPSLKVYFKEEWGAANPVHRTLIRAELKKLLPENSLLYTSISHTKDMGMVAICDVPVGIDIELAERPHDRIVRRISTAEEMSEAPSAASLWCAKEAAFKALRPFNQPPVVGEISIGGWQKIDSRCETFRLKNPALFEAPLNSSGVIFFHEHWALSFFIFKL
jgi:hypothetical protein